jgi:hypothetical protein
MEEDKMMVAAVTHIRHKEIKAAPHGFLAICQPNYVSSHA